MRNIIIVDQLKNWTFNTPDIEVMEAATYLRHNISLMAGRVRIFNFCRSLRYQSLGYYVALIAEARGHAVVPSLTAIEDIRSNALINSVSEDLQEIIQKALKPIIGKTFILSVYFKHNVAKHYDRLARLLAERFQLPMFKVEFVQKHGLWHIKQVLPIPLKDIPESHVQLAEAFAQQYFQSKRFKLSQPTQYTYDLAILLDDKDPNPPSNAAAIQYFIEAGKKLGIRCEIIGRNDFSRLAEFDALFIRTTTSVNNFTYRFARKAHVEGLVVIDDPTSIIRCGNKIYLHESLKRLKLNTPDSLVIQKKHLQEILPQVPFPCVLKLPDGAFSKGVQKAENREQFLALANQFFETTDLLLVQGFVPTEFDWRIGILDHRPLYACQYYMAEGHWQIYNWNAQTEDDQTGLFRCIPCEEVPASIIEAAIKSAKLMGDGLYGVDIKQNGEQIYVIEVNDNPSIEHGVEDSYLGFALYQQIMESFLKRLQRQYKL